MMKVSEIKRLVDQEAHIYSKIKDERVNQLAIFGEQSHIATRWLAILGEEFGEICTDVIHHRKSLDTEVLHVAAVCVAWLRSIEIDREGS